VPPEVAPKRLLLHISAHLEAYAADHDHSSVMLVGFQRAAFFSPTKLALYRGLAEHNALTLVAAEGVPRIDEHTFHVTCLPQNSAMAGEWQVILITAHYAAAFVARDLGDDGPDRDRRFEFIYTHDRDQVIAAARAYVQNVDVSPTQSGPAR
jgi:DICT domain-containing protein